MLSEPYAKWDEARELRMKPSEVTSYRRKHFESDFSKLHAELLVTFGSSIFPEERVEAHQKELIKFPLYKTCLACCKAECTAVCARCKKVFFCSRECQLAVWKAHKAGCRAPPTGST